MSENTTTSAKKGRKPILLFFGVALGVLLLLFGSMGIGEKSQKDEKEASAEPSSLDPVAYARSVEEQVVSLCSRVQGAGQVSAVVTLKGGYRAVYATDAQSNSSGYKSSMVLVGSGSSESAVLVCYENPEIAGIGIVCDRAVSDQVKEDIVSLVSATFRVGSNRIYVASGSSY